MKKIWPLIFSTSTPKESAEHAVKFQLQLILDCIKQWKKFKRSALEHNFKVITDAMEKADLLSDD